MDAALSILQGSLADDVAAALDAAGVPYALTITRMEGGGPNPWDPPSTPVDYDCRGWIDQYSDFDLASTLIAAGDRKVFILIATLDITPSTTDALTVDGTAFTIIGVKRDPAGALWEVQARA